MKNGSSFAFILFLFPSLKKIDKQKKRILLYHIKTVIIFNHVVFVVILPIKHTISVSTIKLALDL